MEREPRVHVTRLSENLGIMRAMRVRLETADGDYVVPMNADELLTPDALASLARAIGDRGRAGYLYSDEDISLEGIPRSPYLRPDWDPVLNLSSFYIWHLVCVRRDMAMELGLYTDAGATWCHDWDTVLRITDAGHEPVHVPEVLYHWRRHGGPTTNRRNRDSGSRRSVRHVLRGRIERQPDPLLYEAGDFPMDRDGGPEDYLLRRPKAPPATGLANGVCRLQSRHLAHACPLEWARFKRRGWRCREWRGGGPGAAWSHPPGPGR